MRLTYLCVPLFAVFLAGCGDDERETGLPMETPPPATEEYGTPTDPSADPMDPNNDRMQPPADSGTGLGTEYGTGTGQPTDPATGEGTGTTQ